MSIFEKMIIIILLAIALIVLPAYYSAEKMDDICQVQVQNETTKFLDNIQTKGYITEDMYIHFINQLDSTGNIYDITLEHMHTVVDPETDESGAVIGYEEYGISFYEDEILETIKDGKKAYRMAKGDYISIMVKNRSDTMSDEFDKMLYASKPSEITIFATAGGIIRDEETGD